jgi:hypothetical protein
MRHMYTQTSFSIPTNKPSTLACVVAVQTPPHPVRTVAMQKTFATVAVESARESTCPPHVAFGNMRYAQNRSFDLLLFYRVKIIEGVERSTRLRSKP